jgi:predicted nucleic-acid-binding Zn-ribbon protein
LNHECPKCGLHDLVQFAEAVTDALVNKKPHITTEEWDKKHKIPMMEKIKFSSYIDIDAYRCPVCGYVELWSEQTLKKEEKGVCCG